MSHKYLNMNERNKIEVLLKENYSVSKIAKMIGVHRSAIYREIKRCNSTYGASIAQKQYLLNSKKKGKKSKISKNLISLIRKKLKRSQSPQQIIGRELKGKLSFKTIITGFILVLLKLN